MSRGFRPLVPCYHAVTKSWLHHLAVDPVALEEQVSGLLRRGYYPASMEEVVANSRRALHVTFDDAFQSVATALPILARLGVRSTIFACPEYALDGRPVDIPELASEARDYPAELATMAWDQLREVTAEGVEVGSHSLRHNHLTQLSDTELARDLHESRAWLEAELGRPCRFLAYPYGDADRRVHAAARAAGYQAAFASPGRERPVNLFALPRVGIWRSDGTARVAFKTSRLGRRLTRSYRRLPA